MTLKWWPCFCDLCEHYKQDDTISELVKNEVYINDYNAHNALFEILRIFKSLKDK